MYIAIHQQDRHFNITFKDFWFLSGFTSIAIPQQDRHFNITFRGLWFLSGFTSIAIPLNALLQFLSCWSIAIDVNPDKNHKPLNAILYTF
jgi:hypothetical protein